MTRDRVLIVYPFLHHYRYGVFNELQRSSRYEFKFVSDISGSDGIEVIPPSAIENHRQTRTLKVFGIVYQRGLLKHIAKSSATSVIFLGDVKNLSVWLGAILSRLQRKDVLFWTIGWHRPESGLKLWIRKRFYELSDHLMFYGHVGQSLALRYGIPADKITIIRNSAESLIDSQRYTHEEWRNPFDRNAQVVGAVIRLTPAKRLDLLIRAVALLNRRGADIKVILAGEGPERINLEQLAADLAVDVHFSGALYAHRSLSQLYSAIDVTVVPAAAGLTTVQSMVHGTPVVTDDAKYQQMPEWEAVLPGETGELYSAGSVVDLAAAIERCFSRLKEDPGSVASKCRQEAERNWSPDGHANAIIEVLDALSVKGQRTR